MEQWRDIEGYVGLYQVSDLGRVRRLNRDGTVRRILKGGRSGKFGHITVNLCKKGTQRNAWVHRLVAIAFIGPVPDDCEVSHKDRNASNNVVSNLCYLDPVTHNRSDQGRSVVRSDGKKFDSMGDAADYSNCNSSNICAVCNGRRKSAGGYSWRYADIES